MATTANRGYRIPAATDRVTDGYAAIDNLASDVDADVAAILAGTKLGRKPFALGTNGGAAIGTSWTCFNLWLDPANPTNHFRISQSGAKWVVPDAGWYRVSWSICYPGAPWQLQVRKNDPVGAAPGGTMVAQAASGAPGGGMNASPVCTAIVQLAANDTLSFWAYNGSGAAQTGDPAVGAIAAAEWVSA